MTDECVSPLRRRMIEDMTVRNFVPKTQSDYIRRIRLISTAQLTDCCLGHITS